MKRYNTELFSRIDSHRESVLDYLKSNGLFHRVVEIDGDQIFNEFLRGIK